MSEIKPSELKCETCGKQFVGNANPTAKYCDPKCKPNFEPMEEVFTYSEVQQLIQGIYSEFVELESPMKTTAMLRYIIEQEVEQHPLKPIQIFKK